MSKYDTFTGAQFATEIVSLAQAKGMTLEVGTDFGDFADIVAKHRPEQPLGDTFDPTKQGVNHENGFWVTGWTDDGTLVHTQAMRCYELPSNLADFLSDGFRKFPPSGVPLDLKNSRYLPGPGAKGIRGLTCYHGEGWLKGGDNTFRGTGINGALTRFGLASAALRWSPDYVFGFMSEGHAYRGLVEREGYMHTDPGAMFWHLSNSPEILRGFMVWMGRADIEHIMGTPPDLLLH